ncbi:MAG: UDP-N-acetylglucosamine--N-acetylmuramyl-(pentapeptide) pyrophosphoryl-undecaprenol N-acetylglucosamine transferase [Halieaceae bacterium]|jgi:UDP-N-acetylglucosamine--N-acetylmuramyl-(pentapeptide) pyrophosphoryl-undecaprenol N-acetylglucosamine transferase
MSARSPLALMLAGGTGGHVYPALAVALELRARGYRLGWVGTARGLESKLVPAAGITLHCLPMRGLRGKGLLQQLVAVTLLVVSVIRSLALLLRLRPAIVVGMGGYASFPAALAAWILRRPLLLQEQNAVPGSANRVLARFADCIATGFPGVFGHYPQARYLGNPLRSELLAVADARAWTPPDALRVLVLGGSLGARPLNEQIPRTAARLGTRCEWLHQCGREHEEATRDAYAALSDVSWQVQPFVVDMAAAYQWADLVICRAGALTIAELAATGRPAILVPLPHAIDDHQSANARFLADAEGALLLPQGQLVDSLDAIIGELLAAPERLHAMAQQTRALGRPRATADIADRCEELCL